MKIWNYKEAKEKILRDCDLEDQDFVDKNELIGYFNEGLTEAEAEIQAMNQDYFLTKTFIPLTQGQQLYDLPENIFANKIRGIFYLNGEQNYPVTQFRRKNKFENIALTDKYAPDAFYEYLLVNEYLGQSKIQIHPPSRDVAIMPPNQNPFTPMTMWYIRNCARVPLIGEFCNPELISPSQVNIVDSEIQTHSGTKMIGIPSQGKVGCYPGSIPYKTGDAVKFHLGLGPSTLPSGLTEGVVYYVIAKANGIIKLATTKQNALLDVPIAILSSGSGSFILTVAATLAIIDSSLLDIPEYTHFVIQWVKVRTMGKEGDPRFEAESRVLEALKKSMIDTLTERIQDDDNEIEADFSYYNQMS